MIRTRQKNVANKKKFLTSQEVSIRQKKLRAKKTKYPIFFWNQAFLFEYFLRKTFLWIIFEYVDNSGS